MADTIETISHETRRRFILGKQGLWPGRRWAGKLGAETALQSIEAVQVDPVSVVTQSHDIVLWGRVNDYQPVYLLDLAYKERRFFDYGGGLMIYPMSELPCWRMAMERQRSSDRFVEFDRANPGLLDAVREEVKNRGPVRSRELQGQRVNAYRSSKDTGVALYNLWLTGELMTHHRHGKERVYDFAENIVPSHYQYNAGIEEAEARFARKSIALPGLTSAKKFRYGWRGFIARPVSVGESTEKLNSMIESGEVMPVRIDGQQEEYYMLAADAPLLETLQNGQIPESWQPIDALTTEEVTFLSPLEYVSARRRAGKLFDFDYIWEIYKPVAQRHYGPYTMPVLFGDRLVARMDAKVDRQKQTLQVNGIWLEAWFDVDDSFRQAFERGLTSFLDFLGVSSTTRPLNFDKIAVKS